MDTLVQTFIEYDPILIKLVWWVGANPLVLESVNMQEAAVEVQALISNGVLPKTIVDVSYLWK